ncbi:hypothetical protein P618_200343 [Holospora obtusa F1]|uniref:Tc1-like transposase DDE domain-containing protein n=1 Tax=Holospora obtusa F1 TaxID=1399147 RepID=W6TEV4_HOLOB|nr:hypothetical protein P618_200343 [Holospora obtusa F1]
MQNLLIKRAVNITKNSYCSGFTNKAVITPMVFNGSCNTQLFEAWVAQFLIKKLKPGQVFIMDHIFS